ncbi:tRNA (pseudouridine(54)-N(1))-methyltransferase TrmY [Candidatus Woesearchaeota archaeon]|nr:tRNA (pseudouridine(54)-N(1))-methyltransferase TrmY [Candidatus Woesearchaeota archaeon]
MREFILLASKAITSPNFDLNNLSEAGRLNFVCATISNSLFVSNHMRQDTIIHVVLNGPKYPPKIISLHGNYLKNFEPDERTIASFISLALKKGINLELNQEIDALPGIKISKKSFETLIKEKATKNQVIYLHPKGEDIRKFNFEDNPCFILGDYQGIPKKTERFLDRFNAKKIKLSPITLFASHCPILVHNELDRRLFNW